MISSYVTTGSVNWTNVLIDTAAGALSGLGVDLAIATAGIAAPLAFAAISGAAAGGGASAGKQYLKDGSFDRINWGRVIADAAIGAGSNLLTLGLSLPKDRVTSGNIFKRLFTNSKNALQEGALKVSQHGTGEIVKKSTYKFVVAGNVGFSVGSSAVVSASNMFWSERVISCLLY